jgi:hypothetical protein
MTPQVVQTQIIALIKTMLNDKSLAIPVEDFYEELKKIVKDENIHNVYRTFIENAEMGKLPFIHYIDGYIVVIPLWLTPEQKATLKYVYELTNKYYTWLWIDDNVVRNKTNTLDALTRLFISERIGIADPDDLHGPIAYAAYVLAKYYGLDVAITKHDYQNVEFMIQEIGKIMYMYDYHGSIKRVWDP